VTDDLEAAMGEAMGAVRRDVEAAVRIPPYELVLRRHHRRRRRAVGAGGIALAALVAAGFAVLPAVGTSRGRAVAPASAVSVSVAPQTGPGRLTLSDVSFADATDGAVLGRRCAARCADVVAATTDGGQHYGTEVTVPGDHRYLAVLAGGREIAYGPDLAVSDDGGASWSTLAVPAPVADVSLSDGRLLVLLVPPGAEAQLWQGPVAAAWSAYAELGAVRGSDDTARLQRPDADTVIVVSSQGVPRTAVTTLRGGTLSWRTDPIAACGGGAVPSVSAVTATTWWVACQGQADGQGAETVAVTTDAGATYTAADPPASASVQQQVTALSASRAYLEGGAGLLETSDGGATWSTVLPEPALGAPHVPGGVGGQDVWVVSPGGDTVWRTNGGPWTGIRLR
jgi:hypothetical protein